jgi:putative phosphoesterase
MRVAAIYDIHGNLPALDAALADIEELGVDAIVVGGDIASGPMPAETLERLRRRRDPVYFIRGNADRRYEYPENAWNSDDIWLVRGWWAEQQLNARQRDFLDRLPEQAVLTVVGLGPVLFCHGSPRSDEEIITPATSDARLAEILAEVREEVVVCGHTHVQFDRRLGAKRIVNAGSVGIPYEAEPGAYWALLGPDVQLRRSPYDFKQAAELIRESGYPGADEHIEMLFVQPSPSRRGEAIKFFEKTAEEQVSKT